MLTCSVVCLCSLGAFAQADSAAADSRKTTLTIGATYSNNASYYGQQAEEAMPYAAATAALRLRSGIYFTGTGYRLLKGAGAYASAGSAGAGVAINQGKKLTADINYSYTFYPDHSPFLQASNPHNAGASLQYEYWMTSGVNVDYYFGGEPDVFVTLGTEKLINLGSLASGKDIITLTPAIEIVGGTQRFYQSYVQEKLLRDSLLGIPLPSLLDIPGTGATEETVTASSTQFNLISYNLRVPLAYNRTHYMIEAAYQLSLLGRKAETGAGKVNSFFNFSFYYQF